MEMGNREDRGRGIVGVQDPEAGILKPLDGGRCGAIRVRELIGRLGEDVGKDASGVRSLMPHPLSECGQERDAAERRWRGWRFCRSATR